MNTPAILAALGSDSARAAQCLAWQQEQARLYMQGQAEVIADIVLSTSDQFKGVDLERRREIGRQRWSSTTTAQKIAGDEELFGRWHDMYATAALRGAVEAAVAVRGRPRPAVVAGSPRSRLHTTRGAQGLLAVGDEDQMGGRDSV